MKDALIKAIKDKDSEIDAAEVKWEQNQRDIPATDVKAGLVEEFRSLARLARLGKVRQRQASVWMGAWAGQQISTKSRRSHSAMPGPSRQPSRSPRHVGQG